MGKIRLSVYGPLREKLGWSTKEIEYNGVKYVFKKLLDKVPELKNIVAKENKLREDFIILINGIHIQFKKGLDAEVCDGDEIAIFPPGGGG